MNLKFIDNQETFRLDDSKVFKKSIKVILYVSLLLKVFMV